MTFSRGNNRQKIWRLAQLVEMIRGFRAYRHVSRESLRRALWALEWPHGKDDVNALYSPKHKTTWAYPASKSWRAWDELPWERRNDPGARIKRVYLFPHPDVGFWEALGKQRVFPICAVCDADVKYHSPYSETAYCNRHRPRGKVRDKWQQVAMLSKLIEREARQ